MADISTEEAFRKGRVVGAQTEVAPGRIEALASVLMTVLVSKGTRQRLSMGETLAALELCKLELMRKTLGQGAKVGE